MGAGKSTIGKKLAERMNYRFVDIDSYIEDKEQMSIRAIFHEKGESFFRQMEHDVLLEISEIKENMVVSTGGGAPCYMKNMEMLNSSGVTIYLKLEPSGIYKRLSKVREKSRPLIENKTSGELMQFIIDKLTEREPVYNKSHLIVPVENQKIHDLHKIIVSFISHKKPS